MVFGNWYLLVFASIQRYSVVFSGIRRYSPVFAGIRWYSGFSVTLILGTKKMTLNVEFLQFLKGQKKLEEVSIQN